MECATGTIAVCAHRGASGTHPENTALAYEAAIEMGATMLEFDVRCSSDGRCVIMHDATVDRTTNGRGAVASLTLAELRALDAGCGQRVPTLDEALAFAERALLNIHAYPTSETEREIIAGNLLAAFADGRLARRAFVACNDRELLRRLRQANPAIRLCTLYRQSAEDYVQAALAHHVCEVLQPRNSIVTRELVTEAHRRNLRVNPFYADEPVEMRRLLECGVDGILTNYPARLVELLASAS